MLDRTVPGEINLHQKAYRLALSNPHLSGAISNMVDEKQMRENVAVPAPSFAVGTNGLQRFRDVDRKPFGNSFIVQPYLRPPSGIVPPSLGIPLPYGAPVLQLPVVFRLGCRARTQHLPAG